MRNGVKFSRQLCVIKQRVTGPCRAGFLSGGGILFAVGLIAFAAHLVWQIRRLDIDDPDLCLRLFKSDRDAGLILFAGLVLDVVV